MREAIQTRRTEVRKVKTHTFAGVSYDVDVEGPFDGICEFSQGIKRPALRVAVDIGTQGGLETLLHECLHAEVWAKTEEVVDRASYDITRLLWRLGYRRK